MNQRTEQSSESIQAIVDQWVHKEGPLLPILHAIQAQFGYIATEAVPMVAKALNLSRAEVHGVISFYHDFKTEPSGENTIQICRAEACQAMGSASLEEHAKEALGLDWGETTADGRVTLEPVYCLGNCACSPSIRINDDVHARVSNTRFDELIANLNKASSNNSKVVD